MAKKSMIAREVKREKLVAKYAAKRAALKAISAMKARPMEERFQRVLKLGETAAQQLGHTLAQPLPADRSSARVLPQTKDQPDCPA